MKYALVLASDIAKNDWICYAIAGSVAKINSLNCYNPTFIKLPKLHYPGIVNPSSVFKPSCATGNNSEFNIVKIDNLNLSGLFNFA